MRSRIRWIAGAPILAATLMISGVAIATGPTGSVVTQVIGAGSVLNGAGFAATPEMNTVVAQITFGPNSSSGWHTHPGKTSSR